MGKSAITVLVVEVETAFLQCAKALKRSFLWEPDRWPPLEDLPSSAEMLAAHANGETGNVRDVEALLEESYTKRLY